MKAISKNQIFLLLATVLFALMLLLNPFAVQPLATKILAIAVLMITLWVSEALPMPVVALLPIVLFPLMGICKVDEAAAPYANPVVFLFMGGFLIGLAIEKWHLHKRIALNIVQLTGTSGNKIILGFILSTGLLSMWLSNTATTMMMYPIAMSVVHVMEKNNQEGGNIKNMAICILLAIAYASNFGGIATIIGTPPNVAFVGFLEKKYKYTFQFADWMLLCLPIALLLMGSLYFIMTRWLYKNNINKNEATAQLIKQELKLMGKISTPEKRVLVIFCITALLWITKDLLNTYQTHVKLDDTLIAIFGAILLFIVPSKSAEPETKQLLVWQDTQRMAWGILLLFGGGISLANQLEKAGLIQQLGTWIAGYAGNNLLLLVFMVTIISIFISEVMSNVAQVIVFAPVVAGIADALHISPLLLGIPMTLGASCASMLPMGTPPNAIVFASGRVKLGDMLKTGFAMNLISTILITLFCYYLLPLLVHAII
jgi:solute carrier family 13 (sodium-dependent dicarboxylate transporter), member 2/3/5